MAKTNLQHSFPKSFNHQIDAYIERSADFAKPILDHIRKVVHAACPEVEEAVKWGMPFFLYDGMMCNMAAFKEHCSFGFWKGKLIFGDKYAEAGEEAMGSFGRIKEISDLPSESILIGYIKKAMKLNEEGVKAPSNKARPKAQLKAPPYFMAALRKNKKALETYRNFTESNKRDYVEWVVEAKTEETRKKRLGTAIEWMAEGKARNWKYMKK
ncbi:MAG TPA: YdeI/OmpD-associated family protein [Candidatus Acidoferrales bacterium]|nr:YdeI/OmpD-associated family protein [Candidatus Acidoferrales bacterium]